MQSTLNNIPITGSDQNIPIICFDNNYNIYSILEPTSGVYEKYQLIINASLSASTDGQYSISFLGNSISNVINPQNSKGQYFYIKDDSQNSTSVSITNALRACPNINASFNVYFEDNVIYLEGRNYGYLDEVLQTNISSTDMTVNHTGGTTSNAIVNSDVNVEIYDENLKYITSLSKTFIKDDIAFNVSPVLSTFSEYGKMKQYYLESYYVGNDGEYTALDSVYTYHTKGFKDGFSEKYISGGTKILIAHPDIYKLWTYGNNIHYMLFSGFGVGRTQVDYICYDSDESIVYQHTDTITPSIGSPEYQEITFTIPPQYYNSVYKIKIQAGNDEIIFNTIKPLKMTDGYTRVCVYNEYGGITYFDFTGKKSYSISKTNNEYEKNIYDYYTSDAYEENKIYKIDKSTEYTLTSHILDKDSLFIMQTLSLAKKVWIEKDDGTKIPIIITSVSYGEESNYSTAYRITLKYKKSYEEATE